jgi:acyl-CoA synthetase (AMP-forming)/AMP-acid ligase II
VGFRAGTDAERRRLSSAGLPVPGVEVRIAGEQGEELANGEAGEIWVRHRGVISGYFDNPEQTAQEFAGGWWMSGDLGLLDHDGFLYLIDRKKDMIVTGGFNVYAAEVEAALHAHPGVLLAAVAGIPSAEWGEAVHAEVILRDGAVATDVELMQHVKDAIGAIKAPKSITLVGGLPMSAVGKVLRRKVQDKYWQGRERRIG